MSSDKLGSSNLLKEIIISFVSSTSFLAIINFGTSLYIVGKYGFNNVPPSYRLWIWNDDLEQAKADLGLDQN